MKIMKESDDIINTLKNVDCEATESPYWLILDPKQNMDCNIDMLASQITGPFFCRKDAEEFLKGTRYNFSKRANVYCCSGYGSSKYMALCRVLKVGYK
jgi:hypothetical protein